MDSVARVFDRYEEIRARLPAVQTVPETRDIGSLGEIAPEADAFVFDAFGVLNVGERPIPGAAERLDELRAAGCAIRILSNAASYDHAAAVEKFRRLGMRVTPDEIVTSRDATLPFLGAGLWGCIAAPGDSLADLPAGALRLAGDPADYARVDGFVFLSTERWDAAAQAILAEALQARPRPVMIANADLVAPRETGFTLEPGHYGHQLVDQGLPDIRFFGKPYPEVYRIIEASLPGIRPERIVMCGDSLHTDILGAAAQGWRSVLVTRDGLFTGEDTASYSRRAAIHPTWRLPRI